MHSLYSLDRGKDYMLNEDIFVSQFLIQHCYIIGEEDAYPPEPTEEERLTFGIWLRFSVFA